MGLVLRVSELGRDAWKMGETVVWETKMGVPLQDSWDDGHELPSQTTK